jgi:hypothetical protein
VTLPDRIVHYMTALPRGTVVSKEELAEVCWPNPDTMPDWWKESLKVHIWKARKKGINIVAESRGGQNRGYRMDKANAV